MTIHSGAQILAKVLWELGYLTQPSVVSLWPAYINNLPDVVVNAVALFDTSGVQDGRIMATGEQIVHPGVELLLRSDDLGVIPNPLRTVAAAMDGIKNYALTIDSNSYILRNASRRGEPMFLGRDPDNPWWMWSLNTVLTISSV